MNISCSVQEGRRRRAEVRGGGDGAPAEQRRADDGRQAQVPGAGRGDAVAGHLVRERLRSEHRGVTPSAAISVHHKNHIDAWGSANTCVHHCDDIADVQQCVVNVQRLTKEPLTCSGGRRGCSRPGPGIHQLLCRTGRAGECFENPTLMLHVCRSYRQPVRALPSALVHELPCQLSGEIESGP